jgi:hypothetical protein
MEFEFTCSVDGWAGAVNTAARADRVVSRSRTQQAEIIGTRWDDLFSMVTTPAGSARTNRSCARAPHVGARGATRQTASNGFFETANGEQVDMPDQHQIIDWPRIADD